MKFQNLLKVFRLDSNFCKRKAFTFVEVLVTVVILSFFVVIVGTLMIYSYTRLHKGEVEVSMYKDIRYARLRIEHELRSAKSIDNISSLPGSEIQFTTFKDRKESFRLSGNQIIFVCLNPRIVEPIIDDITLLRFERVGSDQSSILVTISYTYIINEATRKTNTGTERFVVKCRNFLS